MEQEQIFQIYAIIGCSICTRVRYNVTNTYSAVVGRWDSTSLNKMFFLNIDATNHFSGYIGEGAGGGGATIAQSSGITAGVFNSACLVYNGSNTTEGYNHMYLNGILSDTSATKHMINSTLWNDSESTFIGTYDDSGIADELNGTIDYVYLYNRPITAREVKQLYNNGTYVNNSINETNSAIEFYNSSIQDGIRLPSATTYDLKGGATFAFWADGGTTNVKQLLGLSSTDNTNTLTLYNTVSGLKFEDNNDDKCNAPVTLDDEWHHYVLKI